MLLDELHQYFPAILYETDRFHSVESLLQYVQNQAMDHGNRFSRNQIQYQENRQENRQASIQESIPRTPIRSSNPPIIPGAPSRLRRTNTTNNETIMFNNIIPQNSTVGIDITTLIPSSILSTSTQPSIIDSLVSLLNIIDRTGTTYPINPLTPVVVNPSRDVINLTTSIRSTGTSDEANACSICQESYTNGQIIRTINHCHHEFHRACIDQWFDRNVHCPVCRFDIRDTLP